MWTYINTSARYFFKNAYIQTIGMIHRYLVTLYEMLHNENVHLKPIDFIQFY